MSLIETVVALFIMAVVLTSSGVFFINGMKHEGLHTQRQTATSLANQALEAAQAVEPKKLLTGRTQAEVAALLGTPGASALTAQDITASGNYDPTATGAGSAVVPTSRTQTVSGQSYLLRTFIDQCYLSATSSQTCTQTTPAGSPAPVLRVTVAVSWTPKTVSCAGGCSYVVSALVDTQADPKFNSNVSHPQITAVTPGAVVAGQTRSLVIDGSGFLAGAAVEVPGAAGTTGTPASNTGTRITADWTAGSTPGSYGLSVVNPDGGRATWTVTVTPAPVLTGITPNSLKNGSSTTVTLTGSGFQTGAQVTLTGGTAASATWVSSTSMTVSLTSTQTGPATLTVTNPDGGTTTGTVTVQAPPPTITSATQGTTAAVNQSTTVVLGGTDFLPGTTVTASTGTVNSVTLTGSTSASVTFTPSTPGASTTFTLTTSSGSASRTITIATVPAPTISAASQSSTPAVGSSTTVTLTGTGFSSGMTVGTSSGSLSGPTVSGSTSVSFTFTPSAANASTTFTVTTNGGSASLTVVIATTSPPTISAVKRFNSTTNRYTITGANFTSPSSVNVAGGNFNLTGTITSTTSTQIVFTLPTGTSRTNVPARVTVTLADGQRATFDLFFSTS